LNVKSATALDDDDPWAAIAAPPPTTRAKPLVAGGGRGKPPTKHLTILTQRYMIRVLHGKKNRKGKEDPPIDFLGSNSQSK
jgi:hypothetical protein